MDKIEVLGVNKKGNKKRVNKLVSNITYRDLEQSTLSFFLDSHYYLIHFIPYNSISGELKIIVDNLEGSKTKQFDNLESFKAYLLDL